MMENRKSTRKENGNHDFEHQCRAGLFVFKFLGAKTSARQTRSTRQYTGLWGWGICTAFSVISRLWFDTFGVDISDLQLERANAFCKKKGLEIDFRKADMRKLPFEDDYFDCVYEHYAMCHLNKQNTAVAIGEMNRVTRQGGFCFLGVISTDSWPKYLFGQEKQPGEYWENEDRHTMFTDQEADELVRGWKTHTKEKRVLYLPDAVKEITQEKWMSLYPGSNAETTIETWQNQYAQRERFANYSHIYYMLEKE